MFCTVCGKELPDNAKFCGSCGASLDPSVQQPASVEQSAPLNQTPPPQPSQPSKPTVDVKAEISKLQGKLDNSNSSFLKGRSLWDVVGLCAVVLILICYFLPAFSYGKSSSFSSFSDIASELDGYLPLLFFFVYLCPAILCTFDFLLTRDNATRHPRMVVLGALGWLLNIYIVGLAVSNLSSIITINYQLGFYLLSIAYLTIIVVGIVGIVEKKKGKIAG